MPVLYKVDMELLIGGTQQQKKLNYIVSNNNNTGLISTASTLGSARVSEHIIYVK